MKRTVIVLAVTAVMTALFLSPALARAEEGQEKYADIKVVVGKYAQLMKVYIEDCEKTKNAKDYAAAIRQYRLGMEKLIPEIGRVMKKYDELSKNPDPPKELEPMVKLSQELFRKMAEANAKNYDYFQDPEVIKENKKLEETLIKLQKQRREVNPEEEDGKKESKK